MGRWLRLALLASLASLSACTLLVSSQTNCNTNDDCSGNAVCNNGLCLSVQGEDASTPSPDAGGPDAGPGALQLAVELSGQPIAGQSVSVTVTAKDATGARQVGFRGTVHFSSTDPGATLPGDYPFVAVDQGAHTFAGAQGATFVKAGAQTLTAKDQSSGVTAQVQTTVQPGQAASFLVAGIPLLVSAGAPSDLTVTAVDTKGNTAAAYLGIVRVTSTDPAADLPAEYAFTAADNGVHAFTGGVTLKTAGTQSVVVADKDRASLTGKEDGIVVRAGRVARLSLSGILSPVDAGSTHSIIVTAVDANKNPVTAYVGKIHFTSNDGKASLPPDYPFLAADNGSKSLSPVVLKTVQISSVTATDTADNTISGTLGNIDVHLGAASQLGFTASPLGGKVNQSLGQVKVAVEDAGGNIITTASDNITVALGKNTAAATLGGTVSQNAVAGEAIFGDLTIDKLGTGYTLVATSGGLAQAESAVFDVNNCEVGYKGPTCTDCIDSYHHPASAPSTCVPWCAEPMPCTNPPLKKCAGNASVTYDASGTCSPDANPPYYKCDYAPHSQTCSGVCDPKTGDCAVDPCQPNPCKAKAATCSADHVTLTTYHATCAPDSSDPTKPACTDVTDAPLDCTKTGPKAVCYDSGTGFGCNDMDAPAPGQILISEVMHTPVTGVKWCEIANLTTKPLNLAALTVTDAGNGNKAFTLPAAPQVLPSTGFFVLGETADPAAKIDLAWTAPFTLAATGDLKITNAGSTLLEELKYDAAFPSQAGASMNLSASVFKSGANARAWFWCKADPAAFIKGGAGDTGTPGAANGSCGLSPKPTITACKAAGIDSDAAFPLPMATTGRVEGVGLTDLNTTGNDEWPWLVGEAGFGTTVDATAGWTWVKGDFNPLFAPTGPPDNAQDELSANITFGAAGIYSWAWRFALIDPATGQQGGWTYCNYLGIAGTPTVGPWALVIVATTATQIAKVKAATDQAAINLPISGALVTYTKPAFGGPLDDAGFFIQSDAAGPGIYVAIDPATAASPALAVGDKVSFLATKKDTLNGVRFVVSVDKLQVLSHANDLSAFPVDVSALATLVSSLDSWESRLVKLTATVGVGGFTGGGGLFVTGPILTAGYPSGDANLRMRLPFDQVDHLDAVATCTATLSKGTPLWRQSAVAMPAGWVAGDLTVGGCPAPKVIAAAAIDATSFLVVFDRTLDAATDASMFSIAPAVSLTAATVSGREIKLVAGAALAAGAGANTVTALPQVKDSLGSAVDPAHNSKVFDGPGGACVPHQVVISQVYGGGTADAVLKNGFVELHNRGSLAADVSTWSVQVAAKTGNAWSAVPLAGTIAPGGYLLVQLAGGTAGAALPTPDVTSSAVLDVSDGKVLLAKTQVAYAVDPIGDANLVDLLGFGASDLFKGAPASRIWNAAAARRVGLGCIDTGDNNADFVIVPPTPRNSASPALSCGCTQ